MAYVNVAEWKTDQVCEWLKGLDTSVLPYVHSFTNNTVNGQQLLNLRPEDLEQLGVLKLGHQEIILEAVEYLRNFHYELDRENLQLLALHLSCKAHSLRNELARQTDSKPVTTQTLSDVASVVTAVKPLVRWLDRPPFAGQLEYNDKKSQLLKLSLEMATCAQRDRFAEKPIEEIRATCDQLAKLADYVIQDMVDPMILQPASLDLATLKKRPGDDLGFYILPSFHGSHQIAEIKFGSAAHTCGKMEEGDEIVQVNYQTVVGWERKNVVDLFSESPAEVLLTLKRRPRHTKVYGQIYIKPYRLPSNKKTPYATRWQHNLPSPRPELLTIPDFTMPLPRHLPKEPSPERSSITTDNGSNSSATSGPVVAAAAAAAAAAAIGTSDVAGKKSTSDNSSGSSSSGNDSDSEIEPRLSRRLYGSKPRNLVQRRATITGASPTTKHGIDIEQFWKELKQEHSTSFQLRDKAASCAHGLDSVQSSNNRPQTCLGIEQTKQQRKKQRSEERNNDERKVQFDDKTRQYYCEQECTSQSGEMEKMLNNYTRSVPTAGTAATSNKNNCSDISVPLDECDEISGSSRYRDNDDERTEEDEEVVAAAAGAARKERGKLDKSYSTPAYDLNEPSLIEIIDKSSSNKIDNLANYSAKISTSITTHETDTALRNEALDDKTIPKAPSPLANFSNDQIVTQQELNTEDRDKQMQNVLSVAHRVNRIECMQQHQYRINNRAASEKRARGNDDNLRSDENDAGEEETIEISNNQAERNETMVFAGGRESSEEKSESTSSYVEGTGISSSETELDSKKSIKNDEKEASLLAALTLEKSGDKTSENCSFDQVKNNWCSTTRRSGFDADHPDPCAQVISNNKSNSMNYPAKKLEARTRGLTPPEPPPRKYFSKPLPVYDAGALANCSDSRDTGATIGADNRAKGIEANGGTAAGGSGGDEGYRDFVEKSSDFIDESPSEKSSSLIDHYGYTEIYEAPSKPAEDKTEKYEPFIEKFGAKNVSLHNDQGHSETLPRSGVDSPDGSGCSRPTRTLDSRVKQSLDNKDKHCEKGVVNRAMMVARSIGLHTGSNKSCGNNSPRSTRKRNLLLAKRRNVSVKEVGPGDLEGWLTHRSRGAGGAWARSWFVLKSSSLYRFKAQDSVKSDCLIALPGFTASTASEVKSRKYAFKVYHTGTVFYFAADTEDCLALWLDSINKATLGADSQNRTSGLFSETDESENECGGGGGGGSSSGGAAGGAGNSGGASKFTFKGTSNDSKQHQPPSHSHESMFGSLKKIGRKESTTSYKEHEIVAASLDRKYLRFLGSRTQNVPVPTAQFRSYRRVLPTSTPNTRKQDSSPNSPDLRVTVAGSTFYGLSASQSATDVPSTSQDIHMGDYRQTNDRSSSIRGIGGNRRPDDLRGFITLEEFMLGHRQSGQDNPSGGGVAGAGVAAAAAAGGTLPRPNNHDGPSTPRMTPLTSDHVHIRHKNFDDGSSVGAPSPGAGARGYADFSFSNGMIYGHPKNGEEDTTRCSLQRQRVDNHSPKPEENVQQQQQHHHPNHHHHHLLQLSAPSERNGKRSPLGNGSPSYNRTIQEGVVFYPNKQQNTDPTRWENSSNEITSGQFNTNTVQNLTNRQADSGQSIFRPDIRRSRRRRHRRDSPSSSLSRIQPGNDHRDDCNDKECYCNDGTRDSSSPPPPPVTPRRFVRDTAYVGSSGDLSYCASACSDTFERIKREAGAAPAAAPSPSSSSVTRKGSFNLKDRKGNADANSSDKNWIDSLRRSSDKKKNNSSEKARLKNVAQYQPPPIPSCPFDQDRMRATFEMHLDKVTEQHSQKTNRLKSLFGGGIKSPQKPNSLDLPKDSPKTLLGSPRLHRALFRDKSWSQQQQRQPVRSASQSPGDSGISQSLSSYSGNSQSHTLSQSFSSVSSVMSDWSPETPTANAPSKACTMGHPACQKRFSSGNKNWMTPPSLPYIPPPTSTPPPPDDYPGLEYPPVFEPGTYSLTDPSLIRNRAGKTANSANRANEVGDHAAN